MKAVIARWRWNIEGLMAGWTAPFGSVACPDLRTLRGCGLAGEYDEEYPWSVFIFQDTDYIPNDAYIIGEGRFDEIRPSLEARRRWRECFGNEPEGDTLADIYWWQMTIGSCPDGSLPCKPILPTHLRVSELHMPLHSLIRVEKIKKINTSNKYHNRILDVVKYDFLQLLKGVENEREAIRQEREQNAKDKTKGSKKEKEKRAKRDEWLAKHDEALAELPGKVLGANVRKYRIDSKLIHADVEPREPTTAISDDFNRSDENLTSGPWVISSGTWSVSSNAVIGQPGGSGHGYAQHTTNLSSADMYSEVKHVSGSYGGAATRVVATGTKVCYAFYTNITTNTVLRRYFDRAFTTLATNAGGNSAGKTLRLFTSGTTLYRTVDGTTVGSDVTDSVISAPVSAGMWTYSNETLDDFEAADLLAPGNPKNVLYGPLSGPMRRNIL